MFSSLTNNKFLDWSKLKALADDKINVTKLKFEKSEICFWKVGKHYGKRRKCWLPAFSPFPRMFSLCQGGLKSGLCGKVLKDAFHSSG